MSKWIPCPKGCGALVNVPAYPGDGAYGPDALENHTCNPEWKAGSSRKKVVLDPDEEG